MLRVGYRMPLGLMIRPADQIIRELPPSLAAYWLRFPSAPPRLGCLLSCGVRSAPKQKPPARCSVVLALGRAAAWRLKQRQTPHQLPCKTTQQPVGVYPLFQRLDATPDGSDHTSTKNSLSTALEPLGSQGFQLPQTGRGQGVAPLADGLARDAQQLGQRHGRPRFFDGLFLVHPAMLSPLSFFCNTQKYFCKRA